MRNNRQRIPQAVWFGLMLGLPVAAVACSDDSYGEQLGRKADDSVEEVKDTGANAGSQSGNAVTTTEVQIEKSK